MSIFPSNYVPSNGHDPEAPKPPSRYFKAASLEDNESVTLRLCGTASSDHAIAGYQYFTMDGKPRRFPKFPQNYLDDIGLTWAGRNNGTGEKAEPAYFLAWACLIKGEDDFKVWDIGQFKIREAIEAILAMDDYTIEHGEMANFYLTITRKGLKKDTSYSVVPTLKVATKEDQQRWHAARGELFLPALFEGGDPFGGRPSGSQAQERPQVPVTARDELGADKELEAAGW